MFAWMSRLCTEGTKAHTVQYIQVHSSHKSVMVCNSFYSRYLTFRNMEMTRLMCRYCSYMLYSLLLHQNICITYSQFPISWIKITAEVVVFMSFIPPPPLTQSIRNAMLNALCLTAAYTQITS